MNIISVMPEMHKVRIKTKTATGTHLNILIDILKLQMNMVLSSIVSLFVRVFRGSPLIFDI